MDFELEKSRELEIGNFLKEVRESKGKDPQRIAWRLGDGIGKKTVNSLEEGEFNDMKEKKGFTIKAIERAYSMTDEERVSFESVVGIKKRIMKSEPGTAKAQLVDAVRRKRENKEEDLERRTVSKAIKKEQIFEDGLREELEKLKKGDIKVPAQGGSRSPGTADKEYHGNRFDEDSMEDEDVKGQ